MTVIKWLIAHGTNKVYIDRQEHGVNLKLFRSFWKKCFNIKDQEKNTLPSKDKGLLTKGFKGLSDP